MLRAAALAALVALVDAVAAVVECAAVLAIDAAAVRAVASPSSSPSCTVMGSIGPSSMWPTKGASSPKPPLEQTRVLESARKARMQYELTQR